MPSDHPSIPLTTTIRFKDKTGRVVGEKEVATYAGLLARAHEDGLHEVTTSLVQIPTEDNQFVCIAQATVTTTKGCFSGIGDATPRNVHAKIVPHLIRMAETRAKARALRDAVNIGLVALEELGGDGDGPFGEDAGNGSGGYSGNGAGNGQGAWSSSRTSNGKMTDAQRRLLYRMLAEGGIEGDAATTVLIEEAGVGNLTDIDKQTASWLIERLKGRYGEESGYGT